MRSCQTRWSSMPVLHQQRIYRKMHTDLNARSASHRDDWTMKYIRLFSNESEQTMKIIKSSKRPLFFTAKTHFSSLFMPFFYLFFYSSPLYLFLCISISLTALHIPIRSHSLFHHFHPVSTNEFLLKNYGTPVMFRYERSYMHKILDYLNPCSCSLFMFLFSCSDIWVISYHSHVWCFIKG